MLSVIAARAAPASVQRSPRGNDRLGSSISPTPNTRPSISATLTASTRCEALGIVVDDHAPVLTLCRQLLAQGIDPNATLVVYRSGIVALRVRSISQAARLAVDDDEQGRPRFRQRRPQRRGAAPLVQKNDRRAA
jgi:hypothetical protein